VTCFLKVKEAALKMAVIRNRNRCHRIDARYMKSCVMERA
jgi:hypothetical protein